MVAQPPTQDRTSCLPRAPVQILFFQVENNLPHVAILAIRNDYRSRCLVLQRDAALVPTMTVLHAHHFFLLLIRRNITAESGRLRLRPRVRYCGRMNASVTGSENNRMRLNALMSENGAGA